MTSVRDQRDGVTQPFSAAKAAAWMEHPSALLVDTLANREEKPHPSSAHPPPGANAVKEGAGVRWQVRPGSRSALLRRHSVYVVAVPSRTADGSEKGSGGGEDGGGDGLLTVEGRGFATAGAALEAECVRRDVFLRLAATLRASLTAAAASLSSSSWVKSAGAGGALMPPALLEELLARWVMQSVDGIPDGGEAADTAGGKEDLRLLYRDHVTALDKGARVVLRVSEGDEDAVWTVTEAASMSAGQYWVEIAPVGGVEAAAAEEGRRTVRRVDREAVRLQPKVPTYLDAFLPCDDAYSLRGTSLCLYLATLLAVKGTGIGRGGRSPQARVQRAHDGPTAEEVAAEVAVTMARAAHAARRELAGRLQCVVSAASVRGRGDVGEKGPARVVASVEGMDNDMLTLTVAARPDPGETSGSSELSLQVLRRTAVKLARLHDGAQTHDCVGAVTPLLEDFFRSPLSAKPTDMEAVPSLLADYFTRLSTMLLRYRLLLGEKGYNQGPQAAVPPSVMAALHRAFEVRAEGFASPLNAQLPLYGSLFPDTDRPFGSVGSFFDADILSGHVEVNPPFDAVVLERMERKLLESLTNADKDGKEESLLFVVVLPSHDLDEHERKGQKEGSAATERRPMVPQRKRAREESTKTSCDRALRESPFCLSQTLCEASESAYVDGHQHLLRAPFFSIATPTRLIVLGNRVARARYPDAQQRLDHVRAAWRRLTMDELL